MFGPEQSNLRLLGSAHGAVRRTQCLHLVVIIGPVCTCEGGGRFWQELRGTTHREGHHLTGPRDLWQKVRWWRWNPNPGCWYGRKGVRHIRAATVARSHGND